MISFDEERQVTRLSDASMNILGLTAKYFPFPQPTSTPKEPSGNSFKNRSTIGHGYITD
jgi:hypothetical protein